MKKNTLSLGLLALCVSFTSQADTLLGLYAGAQAWNMETSGGFSNDGSNTEFNFEEQTNTNLYVAFEHPIPLIPNVKVQRTAMDTQGDVILDTQFTLGDKVFAANGNAFTDVSLTTTDFILYYELFDNDLVSFDVGLNAKHIDGEFLATVDGETGREEFSGPVPMVYSRLAVGVPFTGFGAFVEGSFLSIDDHTISDDLDDIYSDLEFKGIYAGLEVHF